MAKDPAFLFYSKDFLTGVQDLTMEERGQYITLLCLQHQKGHLSEKLIRLSCGNATADVMAKFSRDENGLFFNKRLDVEAEKRASHSEKQRQRAQSGWEKRKSEATQGEATANATALPLVNVNADVIVNENTNGTAKAKKPKVSKPEIEIIYPFDSQNFIDIWAAWRQYRKDIGKPIKSALSEQQALLDLQKYGEDTAIKMIRQSIANSWQGIFPLKNNENGNQKNGNRPDLTNLKRDIANTLSGNT